MKKALIIGGAVAGAVVLAKRFRPKLPDIDWEQRIAAMPDTAAPKWMFTNIKAIRDNSDRILELLQEERAQPEREANNDAEPGVADRFTTPPAGAGRGRPLQDGRPTTRFERGRSAHRPTVPSAQGSRS